MIFILVKYYLRICGFYTIIAEIRGAQQKKIDAAEMLLANPNVQRDQINAALAPLCAALFRFFDTNETGLRMTGQAADGTQVWLSTANIDYPTENQQNKYVQS